MDAQLISDQALLHPCDDLPRIALAELLESQGEENLARYIRLSLTKESLAEAAGLLAHYRDEWNAIFVPFGTAATEPVTIEYERGLPARITTCGSFLWDGWFTPVTIPLQRLVSRYGTVLDNDLTHDLTSLARYAREHRDGTGLHEVDILHHAVAPLLERLNPILPLENVYKALDSTIHFLREVHMRGLDSGRCPRSCFGLAIRATQRELDEGDICELTSDILHTIDSCRGGGSVRGLLFEGLIPLTSVLADHGSHEPLRSYIPALSTYVNGLADIGVPIEAVMRQQFLRISQSLATDTSARHFQELTSHALRSTRRA
ncbi:MAG: hypothetical protein RL518_2021 [Pseudomonadota bacterium]